MKKILLLLVFLFSFLANAQEICNNAIDDDGDGKIDLNDPDCSCATSSISSIIPNPSFESFTTCPSGISQLNNSTSWQQATIPTTDYFNTCGYTNNAGMTPFPDGNAAVGTFFVEDWQEYLGACLTNPMIAGTNYQLTFNIASKPATGDVSLGNGGVIDYLPIDVVLYGKADCVTFPLMTQGCPSNWDSSWIVLGTVNYTPVGNWGVLNIMFTPTVDIKTVILGSPCVLPPGYVWTSYAPFFYFDNLLLNTAAAFGVNINQTGNYCDNNLVLNANLTTVMTGTVLYQWYLNGIAIVGATSSSYIVPPFPSSLGSYSVKITSDSTCFVSSSVTINNTIPSPAFTVVEPTCIVPTGSITITTPALQYSFDNGLTWQSSPTKSMLPVGTYYIKIKTPSGCISSPAGATINQPQLLSGSNCNVIQPTTCNGTGTITVTSTVAAQYSFDDGLTWTTNNVAANLQPGEYLVKIKDAVGCQSSSQYIYINRIYINQPTYSLAQPTCGVGGTITITTAAAQYSFDDGVTWITNNVASNLPSGSYSIKIKDAAGCESYTQYVYLYEFYLSFWPAYTSVDPVCGTGGSITITTVEAQYSFDGGTTWSTNNTATGLAPGSYSLIVKSALGCTSYTQYVYLNDFYLPTPDYTVVQPVCGTGGSITITTVADQYSFDNGITWSTNNTATNLSPGTHYIMIKNSAGCTSSTYQYVNLAYYYLPDPTYTLVNPACGSNGSITITSAANEYSFDGGSTWSTNPVLSNLSAGYYALKVRNSTTCESNYIYVYLDSFENQYPEYTYTDAGCETYASITITTAADFYSFDNGVTWTTNPFMDNLLGGQTYQIIIRKGLNCYSLTQGVYIPNEYSINPLATDFNVTACDALNDGTENMDLTSYNSDLIINSTLYSFQYYNTQLGAQNADASHLISNPSSCPLSNTNNTVYVRVTSIKNCVTVVALTFTFIDSPRITMENTYPLCEFRSVLIEAGHGFDSYLWSTTQTTHSIVTNAPGDYWVVVTENHGTLTCDSRKDFTIFLSNPATITSIQTVDWTANENIIEVLVTGLGNYEYSLDGIHYQDSNIFENLVPGLYQVFVKDKNGCGVVDGEALLLNYPQFFTPNGDGYNDNWSIKFSQFELKFDVKIFDRYGKLIKVMNSSESWDGTYNGRLMPSDDYWFYVTREDGEIHKGHFAMKR